ncbi:MAG TPA: YicC/YloC family endoribonuclease [Acidobacteriaceae bacterium]|nr:YicC/YloC family endoribonuclease [Terriglobia bacterium]HVC91475.1 YicC/YloC family endoribonuclease [Acidobacteriaceae bacterium]
MSDLPIRSMTGFARITATAAANIDFVLTVKSVNHRYLDLQFFLPGGMDALEMLWRKTIKEHVVRGHVEVRLSVHRDNAAPVPQYNSAIIQAYVDAFRAASREHKLRGAQPDLNAALRLPGVWSMETARPEEVEQAGIELAAAAAMVPAMESLNAMRAQEGQALAAELERTLGRLREHVDELASLRAGMQLAQTERLEQKMREMLGDSFALDRDRILQEAALLAERSDVEEELARLRAHIDQFLRLLQQGGELGKKLDFLLQEMTREANTTLSKTGSIATRSLNITELGLAMKSEIEKTREQVQNLE